MTTADLVRVYEKNLLALDAHARKVSMDDSEHIRLVRVLIETAETLMEEMGKSESKIEATRLVKKLIRIEISISYHLLSASQRLCVLPHMKLRIG